MKALAFIPKTPAEQLRRGLALVLDHYFISSPGGQSKLNGTDWDGLVELLAQVAEARTETVEEARAKVAAFLKGEA